jgi:flagella basal body P-ring formation protein FlgA
MMRAAFIALVLALGSVGSVAQAAQPFTVPTELEATIAERARTALPAELQLAAVHAPAGWTLAAGDALAVEWRTPPRAGTLSVQLTVTRPDGTRRAGWAQLDILALRPVLVARRDLARGELLTADDVEVAPRAVSDGEGVALAPAALDGAPVLRPIAAGTTIGSADVTLPAPIGRGSELTVLVRHGRLTVATRGLLERAARPGERSSARIDDGHRLVFGRVIDGNTFAVEEK